MFFIVVQMTAYKEVDCEGKEIQEVLSAFSPTELSVENFLAFLSRSRYVSILLQNISVIFGSYGT